MQLDPQLQAIAKKAHLRITANATSIYARHELTWRDSSMWGVLIFFSGGIVLTVVQTANTFSKVGCVVLGVAFIASSVLTMIKQACDSFSISGNRIAYCYNLKSASLSVKANCRIRMEAETLKTRRSTSIMITHYLQTDGREKIVFRFSMKGAEAPNAGKLGRALAHMFNERLAS